MNPSAHITALILVGGKGTRLGLGELPKPMVPIAGRPLLEHLVLACKRQGIDKIVFKAGFGADHIVSYFGDGARWGVQITTWTESGPLGTAGGLSPERFDTPQVLVLYGDVLTRIDFSELWAFHRDHHAQASLVVRHSEHPEDSDIVVLDTQARVVQSVHKPGHARFGSLANAAMYLLETEMLRTVPPEGESDFGRDLVPAWIEAGFRVYGFESGAYLRDIGTPDRLAAAQLDVALARVFPRVDAVLLDRDGTINTPVSLLHRREDFVLLPGVAQAIASCNKAGISAFVVTNQPVIARALCSEDELDAIHAYMRDRLADEGAVLQGVYVCPHHPEQGHPGTRTELRIVCPCRKPAPGLLLQAAREHGLTPERTWMVGDSWRDIEAGRNAGMRTILVLSGDSEASEAPAIGPDYVARDLPQALAIVRRLQASTADAILHAILEAAKHARPVQVRVGGAQTPDKAAFLSWLIDGLRGVHVVWLPVHAKPYPADADVVVWSAPDALVHAGPDDVRIFKDSPGLTEQELPIKQTILSATWIV